MPTGYNIATSTQRLGIGLLVASVLVHAPAGLAYETPTHEKLSEEAFLRSSKIPEAFEDLGLSLAIPVTGERRTILGPRNDSLLPLHWIRAGARDEDDTVSSSFARFRNHFYDPTLGAPNSGGFTGILPPLNFLSGRPAPDWALEPTDIPGQHHSYRDARGYLRSALTAASKADREKNLAATLYALGHVVHTIQDLAQPQHARNDNHALGSWYETFTNLAAHGQISGYTLTYGGGATPLFTVARNFWTDQASFSNGTFVSAGPGKNFRYQAGAWLPSERYANPRPEGTTEEVPIGQLPGINPEIVTWCAAQNCLMRFIASKNTNNGVVISRAATYSIFTDDLSRATTGASQVTLNRYNFAAPHSELIPRAVSYTTGLFDYFFRGKIDYVQEPPNSGQYVVKNLGAEPMSGKFRVYYDAADDIRRELRDTNGQPIVWDTRVILAGASSGVLAPGASMSVPALPTPATPAAKALGEYMIVFTGDIGEEKEDVPNQIVGAMAAKLITNPYKGALYVMALDANNQPLGLRVDKTGTKVVYGWDISRADAANPNGVFVPLSFEFNPLTTLYLSGSQPYPVRDKVHLYKQAQHSTTTPNEYAVSSVTLREISTLNQTRSLYGIGLREQSFNEVTWTARSPDEQLGTFHFRLTEISSNGRDAAVIFVRRFNANGAQQSVSGFVPLPTLPVPLSYRQFLGQATPGNTSSALVISDNGLSIAGFTTAGNVSSGFVNSVNHVRINITLADTPQFTLQQTALLPAESGVGLLNPTYVPTGGTCSVTVRRIPDGVPITLTSNEFVRAGNLNLESRLLEPIPFGNIGGQIGTYTRETLIKRTERIDEKLCYTEGADRDPQLGDRIKYSILNTANNHIEHQGGAFAHLTGGSFANPTPNVPSTTTVTGALKGGYPGSPFLCRECNWNERYDGFDPVPPTAVTTPNGGYTRNVPAQTLERALTDRRNDAVYLESPSEGMPFVRKFRSIDLTGKEFTADTSPLGEVFFAISDRSTVIHEPLPGTMPQIQLPANAVKLLGALWL